MKNFIKFFAMIIGLFTVMVGTTSCGDKEECCEVDNGTDTYTICEDDDLQGYTWEETKALALLVGGSCD